MYELLLPSDSVFLSYIRRINLFNLIFLHEKIIDGTVHVESELQFIA